VNQEMLISFTNIVNLTLACTMSTGSFPGVKSGRGVTLTPHPLLLPWSRKSRAILLLPVWAVWPVQSLSDCRRGAHCISLWLKQLLEAMFGTPVILRAVGRPNTSSQIMPRS